MASDKRLILMGDPHHGHVAGLTPPRFQGRHWEPKVEEFQRESWGWFDREIDALGPIHAVIANGDLVDGSGEATGGTEQLTTDRAVQVEMALEVLKHINARRYVLTYGTPYHCGKQEDWEKQIARELGADISAHQWPEVNGVVFDVKHFISGSSIPHGRATALLRDQLWNLIWADDGDQPRGDFIIRNHVHYHAVVACVRKARLVWGMTLPALQAAGTKHGARKFSGTVHFGFAHVDVTSKGVATWFPHLVQLTTMRAEILHL